MKRIIKNIKPFYWLLKALYNKTLLRFKNGYFKHMKEYKRFIKKKDITGLKEKGLAGIKIWNFDSWKFDSGLDHSYRRYYVARFRQKRCFVKIAKHDLTVLNEIYIADQKKQLEFSPNILLTDKGFNEDSFLIVQEYLKGICPLYKTKHYCVFDKWCNEFNNIIDTFLKYNIVHNDVHKGNLVVRKKDNKLFLLDYGISTILPNNLIVDYKARPGTFYRKTNKNEFEIRIYDDAYSFVQEIHRLGFEKEWLDKSDAYNEIVKKIGRVTFTTKIRSE